MKFLEFFKLSFRMRVRSWLTGAMVCVMFVHSVSYEDKQTPDLGLPFAGSVSYSVILSALSGLRRTRKRTAMGMDLTDYLWNKAHEKSRAMVLQRMMKNGKR
ncbi:hypothetical protein JTE90_011033 [Oedothorax gibbosus]|uniref:Uncharacterized protein n=1 Tax=Oedothorax gibbosus TaxID=931172 RepID=A0AAV6VED7_9ARAC|nr:hypothetical protein JTE90_011033 [Oedothorax gibbosus]